MSKVEKIYEYQTCDKQNIRFPVATICGDRPGPHAVITAGIHGGEYPPIVAAIELYKTIDPAEVSGTITIVTVSNVDAFERRSVFVTPTDGKNPNRFFPGREDGSYTECMDYYLFRDFISKANLHLDLHCGDIIESLTPFAEYSYGISPEVDCGSRDIALYYGLPHIIGEQCDLTKPYAGLNFENSARHGIPSALVEAGSHGILDRPSVEAHLFGMKNVLRHFGVLAGEAVENNSAECFDGFVEIEAPVPGLFYRCVEPGDYLQKDQLIGRVEDYFGNPLSEVRSPADGKIMYVTDNPAMITDTFILDMAVKGR